MMLKSFQDSFELLYTKRLNVRDVKTYYICTIGNKTACLDLLSYCKLGTETWTIPHWIYINRKYLKEWLRAFYDCEGYVGKDRIVIQTINKNGMVLIKKLLKKFEIESNLYIYERKNFNWKTNYILIIMRKESVRKYFKEIGFNHSRKKQKLKEIIFGRIE